jgi:hypothetical protein
MGAKNVIRLAISGFIVVLIALSVAGWVWAGSHQNAAQSAASRVVLSLCILAGTVGLVALWRTRTTRSSGPGN